MTEPVQLNRELESAVQFVPPVPMGLDMFSSEQLRRVRLGQKAFVDGVFIVGNPRHSKYFWRFAYAGEVIQGWQQQSPTHFLGLSTFDAMSLKQLLLSQGRGFAYKNIRLSRIAPDSPKISSERIAQWASSFDSDSDPVWAGHK